MKKRLEWPHWFLNLLYGLYFLIGVMILAGAFYITQGTGALLSGSLLGMMLLTGVVLLGALTIPILRKAAVTRLTHRQVLACLAALCLMVKLLFVIFVRVRPSVDYATFFCTADKLSSSFVISDSRYIALFPHIFGYSFFLSVFFRLLGTHLLIPPLLNAILSTVSMILIYYICVNLISYCGACIACGIWILFPSQTIYNIFALSEPLYSAELLGVLSIIIYIDKKFFNFSRKKSILVGFLLGFLLCLTNMARPIAAIPIIAYFLWILVTAAKKSERNRLKQFLAVFAIMLGSYFLFQAVGNWYIGQRLGEAPATIPGYSFCVGFNEKSHGMWNQEDSNLLFSYSNQSGWNAVQTQKQMLVEAKKRILSGNIDFPELFRLKFFELWSYDDCCVTYIDPALLSHQAAMREVCNAFYYATVLFSMVGAVFAIRKKEKSALFLVAIFVIGLSCAQLLVEVAGRYHYSGILTFTILGAYGICSVADMARERKRLRTDS